jgi:cell division inhibitor SulA
MHPTIQYLKNKKLVWQAKHNANLQQTSGQYTGYPELDMGLKGGFPEYGIIDIQSPIGIGELRLILPSIVHRQHNNGYGLSLFIAPPLGLNSEMLADFGVNLDRVMIIQPKQPQDNLWAAEQSLKSGCCHSVVLWHQSLSVAQVKRLQLAAEKGQSLLFIIRIPQQQDIPLPVTLAIQLQSNHLDLFANITKRKGGKPTEPIQINMSQYWPELTKRRSANVINLVQPVEHNHRQA